MKIGLILGTRPEIIKMSSVIRYCQKSNTDFFVIHTNQHYSENMDKIFFDELSLPQPEYNLGIGSGRHGEMTGKMIMQIEEVLEKERPDAVLVQGDTNTVLAGAVVAAKMDIKVAHVEAGLRSYDRSMPEEINRVLTDHMSDYLFPPTKRQKDIMLGESIEEHKIHVVGNTVVDAVLEGLEIAEKKSKILKDLELKTDGYILLTAHRPATVDVEKNISAVLEALAAVAKEHDKRVVFPAHPRTVKMIESFGLKLDEVIEVIEPVGYVDMLMLMKHAYVVVTDSGGIQEEACILERKCAVIRENTERPEALNVGGGILVGNSDRNRIVNGIAEILGKDVEWYNPFGDGSTGQRIIEILVKDLTKKIGH